MPCQKHFLTTPPDVCNPANVSVFSFSSFHAFNLFVANCLPEWEGSALKRDANTILKLIDAGSDVGSVICTYVHSMYVQCS